MSNAKEVSSAGSALPANVVSMAQALAASAVQAGAGDNELYLKFSKVGEWVYGADETEVEEGSIWAVNPHGFMHGWVAWGDEEHGNKGQNVGEEMVPATEPMPRLANLEDVRGNWSKAIAVTLRCTNGEDKGLQVLYKSNSHGGRKAYAGLLTAVLEQINAGATDYVPLVELNSDSYKHGTYGKIYTPDIVIAGWTTLNVPLKPPEEAPAQEVQEAPEKTADERPRRRRRAKAD